MTCREKLRIEYPEWVKDYFIGGVFDCPSSYGYLGDPDFCNRCDSSACTRCWDREIPEKDGLLAESGYQTICDRCKSSVVCKYSGDLNTFMYDVHNRFPFVAPDFKCEYFNDRKENV